MPHLLTDLEQTLIVSLLVAGGWVSVAELTKKTDSEETPSIVGNAIANLCTAGLVETRHVTRGKAKATEARLQLLQVHDNYAKEICAPKDREISRLIAENQRQRTRADDACNAHKQLATEVSKHLANIRELCSTQYIPETLGGAERVIKATIARLTAPEQQGQ